MPSPWLSSDVNWGDLITLFNSLNDDSEGDLVAPHMLLVGENVLVGQIDLPAIHFIASGQKIPMPPSQIRQMTSTTSLADASAAEGPAFEAELWDGGAVSGELMELVLPVQSGGCRARVPASDIVEVISPSPSVPDTVRDRIAQLIRDLGHPEYAQRKAAREALAELGHLPKMQLEETLTATTDPVSVLYVIPRFLSSRIVSFFMDHYLAHEVREK